MLHLPPISPTKPGDDYHLNIDHQQLTGAKLFRSRSELAMCCASLVPPQPLLCELGVYHGDWSRQLYDLFNPSVYYLIDIDIKQINPEVAALPRVLVRQGLSWEQLAAIPQPLDFIYVDADHTRAAVRNDLIAAHTRLKPGGIIQFNDYCAYSPDQHTPYGVLETVNSYLENYPATIVGLSLDRSGYHDIAIRMWG